MAAGCVVLGDRVKVFEVGFVFPFVGKGRHNQMLQGLVGPGKDMRFRRMT